MGQKRHAIFGGDITRADDRVHVAVVALAAVDVACVMGGRKRGPDGILIARRVWGRERDVQRLHGAHRGPGVARQHRDAPGDRQHAQHAGQPFGGDRVQPRDRPAPGRHPHRRVQHVGQGQIDAIDLRAGRFRDHVGARHRLAQPAPLRPVAQHDLGHRLQRRRVACQVRIGNARAVGQDHRAIRGVQVGAVQAVAQGSGLFQRFTRDGARLSQLVEPVGGRTGPTGHLPAQQPGGNVRRIARGFGQPTGIGGRKGHEIRDQRAVIVCGADRARHDAGGGGVDVQFLGDQGGLQPAGALPLVRARRDQRDAICVDQHIGVQRPRFRPRKGVRQGPGIAPGAKGHAPRHRDRPDQKAAPRDAPRTRHQAAPMRTDADRIAARMRG